MNSSFIPLRLFSEYSVDHSMVRLEEAVRFAQSAGFPALALCDHMNMFAAVKFYRLCRQYGIKPILGVDFNVTYPDHPDRIYHLILLAKNNAGYKILCELLTRAYLADKPAAAMPALNIDWLEQYDVGQLICLSGAQAGLIGSYLARGKIPEAEQAAARMQALFASNFYLEINRFFTVAASPAVPAFAALKNTADLVLQGSLLVATRLNLPLVATHPVEFMRPEDYAAHETKVCITSGRVLADPKRPRDYHPCQYFLPPAAIKELFADIPAALKNSWEIACRCTVTLNLGKNYLPLFPTPDGQSLDAYLASLAEQGLEARLQILFPEEAAYAQNAPGYRQRLDFELGVITKMGFAGYFLIVADFINWAKNNGCPVGPGRGSGAGSLVAFSLKITELDPIQYDLLFERFLNPQRVSMPDFDVDFCQENRGRVIDYVRHKYGELAVSQIVTFGTMSSKAVIRDVGRVLGVPFSVCDRLSKLIPLETNRPVSITRALDMEPELRRLIKEEEAEELLTLSLKLEDLVRNTGMHAGGVLIAPGKLTDFCAIYKAHGEDSVTLSMYDKEDVEAVGLVKFDFLGLRNLTTIKMALDLISRYRGEVVDLSSVPLTDAPTFAVFAAANTDAVFQFESAGMKRMLKEAEPSKFDEIIAFVALYRPGPMDLIPDFIRRLQGEKFQAIHPLLEPILRPTYGIMVYQEQVMQAATICAGYTLGEADLLRRAMSKKSPAAMARQRAKFIAGAVAKDINTAKANEIFDYIERFAGYGFNKSHAAAYALIAYQTAWLKAHYPVEFMSATMSGELGNTDQLEIFVADSKKNRIAFLPPDVNRSDYYFLPEGKNSIRYALGAIKGVGEPAALNIVAGRKAGGEFRDLFDFCRRLDKNVVNKRVLESLIKAGAFDSLNSERTQLFANIALAMNYAEQKNKEQTQGGLFDSGEELKNYIQLKKSPPWNLWRRLEKEKEALGFYFSGHPFTPYQEAFCHIPHTLLKNLQPAGKVWLGGFVTKLRTMLTKAGNKIHIVQLDDGSAVQEIIFAEETVIAAGFRLQTDMPLTVQGEVRADKFKGGWRVNGKRLLNWAQTQIEFARCLTVKIDTGVNPAALAQLLQPYRAEAGLDLKIIYQPGQFSAGMTAANSWQILPTAELWEQLEQFLGAQNIKIVWSAG